MKNCEKMPKIMKNKSWKQFWSINWIFEWRSVHNFVEYCATNQKLFLFPFDEKLNSFGDRNLFISSWNFVDTKSLQ